MKIAVAIETKDRRLSAFSGRENYLSTTLTNLKRSGVFLSPHLESLHVVSGGELPGFGQQMHPCLFHDKVFYHACPPEGRTRQQNGAMAIRVASIRDVDYVIKLEDDLDFCADFLGSVARWLTKFGGRDVKMFALAQAFAPYQEARYSGSGESVLGPGESFKFVRKLIHQGHQFYRHDVKQEGGFWGAQALCWRIDRARELVDFLGDDPNWAGDRNAGHDLLVGEWAEFIGAAIPSFVQHIGETSNFKHDRFFQFPWPGRDWWFQ